MLLREHLIEFTKEELLDQARSFEIRKCSGLRKADLIERIVKNFCTEEMMRNRLVCLTKEQMEFFRKACVMPQDVSINEIIDGMPTIVPGSSHAAAMLKDAVPQLQAMGFPLNLNGNADVIPTTIFPNGMNGEAVRTERKIYPNDPCACGSGKKYKKCCGKNK